MNKDMVLETLDWAFWTFFYVMLALLIYLVVFQGYTWNELMFWDNSAGEFEYRPIREGWTFTRPEEV